jgi:hypothetical protein
LARIGWARHRSASWSTKGSFVIGVGTTDVQPFSLPTEMSSRAGATVAPSGGRDEYTAGGMTGQVNGTTESAILIGERAHAIASTALAHAIQGSRRGSCLRPTSESPITPANRPFCGDWTSRPSFWWPRGLSKFCHSPRVAKYANPAYFSLVRAGCILFVWWSIRRSFLRR